MSTFELVSPAAGTPMVVAARLHHDQAVQFREGAAKAQRQKPPQESRQLLRAALDAETLAARAFEHLGVEPMHSAMSQGVAIIAERLWLSDEAQRLSVLARSVIRSRA